MRAVVMRRFGDEDVLELAEVEARRPGHDEVAVRVAAVEVARTRDVAVRTGRHPHSRSVTLPRILGGDFVGVVDEVGRDVDPSLRGARVAAAAQDRCGRCRECAAGRPDFCLELSILGIHRDGSYAEVAVVPATALSRIPDDLRVDEAAAMAADGPLALTQLTTAGVGPGTTLLVTGATGALATTVIALACHLGAVVFGSSRRPHRVPATLALAARLDAAQPALTARLREATVGRGVEVAIDNVAEPRTFDRYFPALAMGAKVVVSGAIGSPELPVLSVPAASLYINNLSLLGVRTARPGDAERFWDLVRDGFRLPGGLVTTLPLAAVGDAHRRVASGQGVGHTVLLL